MIKKGRCSFSGNGPLTFPRQLDVVANAAFVAGTLDAESLFRKCWEKSKLAEHSPILGNKTAGRGSLKQRSGLPISGFHRTSGIARWEYAANSGTLEHTVLFIKRNPR